MLEAKIKDIKMFSDTDSGYKKVTITNLNVLPFSVKANRTNTLKLIEMNKILIKSKN